MFEAFSIFGKIALQGMGQVNQELGGLQQKLKRMGQGFMQAGKKATMGLTLPIVGLATAAFKMAGDFDQSMRATNVMLKASESEMANYKKEILALSSRTGKSAGDIAASFYTIVSAGYRGTDAIDILTQSIEGSVGGMAESQSTTEALTKAMNIFQLEGVEGSGRAMDTFFGIVDTGLLTFEEMGNAFPRAATSAAGLGVSIEETGAALATLTKVSGSTEQASTALNAVFGQLIKPSADMMKLYEEWGVKSGPEALKKFGGLQGVLLKVTEATGGNVDELSKLFPNMEAIRAILPLTTTNANDFTEALETIKNSTGRAGEAFEEMAQGPGYQWNVFMQTAKNALIGIGDVISQYVGPWLEKLSGYVKGAVEWFGKLDPTWQKIILGIVLALAMVGPVLMGIGVAFMALNAILGLTPIGWIIIGIVAAIAALVAIGIVVWKNWDKIKAFFIELWVKIKDAFKKFWDWIKNVFFKFTPLGMIIKNWDKIKQYFLDMWERVKQIFINVWEGIKNIFFNYTPYGLVIQHWDKIVQWFKDMWERVKNAFIEAGQAIWDWMLKWVPGLNLIVENWDVIVGAIKAGWDKIRGFFIGIGNSIKDHFVKNWQTMFSITQTIWNAVSNFFQKIWDAISGWFKEKISAIFGFYKGQFETMKSIAITIWNAIKGFFVGLWNSLVEIFSVPINKIKEIIQTAFNFLKPYIIEIWNSVKEFFVGLWEDIRKNVDRFKAAFLEIWNKIASGLKGPINTILGFFNKMIQGVEDAVNWIVRALNKINIKVPSWVGKLIPGLAGKEWGVNLREVSFGGIPLLQKGADIMRGGAAIVGEKGPEIVELPAGARVSPLENASITIQNIYEVAELIIREEADFDKVQEKLLEGQEDILRGIGYKGIIRKAVS